MGRLKVKHFKRLDTTARQKVMVTEVVETNSETAAFLERLEQRRLAKPCFVAVDMRGKVPGDCQRLVHNNRTFYLDRTSRRLFEQGLQRYKGVYTVGTYEAILNGEHTNKGMRLRQQAERAVTFGSPASVDGRANDGGPQMRDGPANQRRRAGRAPDHEPEIIRLGYQQKRREPRLRYVTKLDIHGDATTYSAQTRDISASGLHVVIKGTADLNVDQAVTVTFTGFVEQAGVDLAEIGYTVVDMTPKETEVHLRLILQDGGDTSGIKGFIDDFITRHKHKYKCDVEDTYTEVTARLYERLYSENVSSIPFFVGRDSEGRLYVQAVAIADGNAPAALFFRNDVDSYDFSAVCLPHRLDWLMDKGELLLMLYRHQVGTGYQIHSAADMELEQEEQRCRFLNYVLVHEEHCIAKVVLNRLRPGQVDLDWIDHMTARLSEKSVDEAATLRSSIGQIVATGMIVDATEQMRTAVTEQAVARGASHDVNGLSCWIGNTRVACSDEKVLEEVDSALVGRPVTTRFGYVERRREDRYRAETRVEVKTGGAAYSGVTLDLSTRGLRIRLDEEAQIAAGDKTTVHLVTLQKKRKNLDLTKIPYQVVRVQKTSATVLMLERIMDVNQSEVTSFFLELIEKNKGKLALDTEDVRNAVESVCYSRLLTSNTSSVPFYLSKSEEGIPIVSAVAVTEETCRLAQFLQLGEAKLGVYAIMDRKLINALYDQVVKLKRQVAGDGCRQAPVEFELYMYKVVQPMPDSPKIVAKSSLEFADAAERRRFMAQAMQHEENCFAKLVASYILPMADNELDTLTDVIREDSRHRAFKLRSAIQGVVALGEIIDLTPELAACLD